MCFMNGLQCRPFFFCPAKKFSENWPKSVFEIVVRVERKKIPAANVPNGVIIINSLHIEEVPLPPYMDRPADTRAGCKHRCTDAAMEHFRAEVMELCHRENLYQIDLLHGSASRVTEREYWEKKKGQAKLDEKADALAAEGLPAKPTKFETDKEKLRKIIRKALDKAGSFDEFSSLLLQQGVIVKESRGRYSYLTPDRPKPITARKLGDDFDKTAVLAALERNALRPVNIVTKRDATRCRRICPRPDTAPAEHTE